MQILLAEDDLMLVDFLVEALSELGHEVCGVGAMVNDTVALVRLHRPDVVILDMHLARQELGTEVASRLAEAGELGRTGVLYITGEGDLASREAGFGHACLNKPFGLLALETAILIVHDLARDGTTVLKPPPGLCLLRKPITLIDICRREAARTVVLPG